MESVNCFDIVFPKPVINVAFALLCLLMSVDL